MTLGKLGVVGLAIALLVAGRAEAQSFAITSGPVADGGAGEVEQAAPSSDTQASDVSPAATQPSEGEPEAASTQPAEGDVAATQPSEEVVDDGVVDGGEAGEALPVRSAPVFAPTPKPQPSRARIIRPAAATGGGTSSGSAGTAKAAAGGGSGGGAVSGGGSSSRAGGGSGARVVAGGSSGGNRGIITGGSKGGTGTGGTTTGGQTGGTTGGGGSGGGSGGQGGTTTGGGGLGHTTNPPNSRPVAERLVSWLTIGGTSHNDSERMISPGLRLQEEGWTGYVQRIIVPQIQWGCRRFVLHNPFGIRSGEVMQLDQLLEARAAGMGWLENDFVAAWKPVVEGRYGQVEVIAYVGTPLGDADFEALRRAGRRSEWLARAWESVQPIVDAGMSVALDMSSGMTADHPGYEFAEALRARGLKVYLEGSIVKSYTWLFPYSFIIMQNAYEHAQDEADWVLPPAQAKSEIVQLLAEPANATPGKWAFDATVKALRQTPHDVAAPVYMFLLENQTLNELRKAVGTQ